MKITNIGAALDPQFEKVDTVTYPLSAIIGEDEESRIEQLERELAEAKAEIVRLKGEAEKRR